MNARHRLLVGLAVATCVVGLLVWVAAHPAEPASPAPDPGAAGLARRVHLTYAVSVSDVPAAAERVEAWIPLPREHAFQSLEASSLAEDYPQQTVEDPEFGNRFLRLDLTDAARAADGSALPITVTSAVARRGYSAWDGSGASLPRSVLDGYLEPDRLVPTDGFIAEEAREVVGDADRPLAKSRRLYDHVVGTMDYNKTGEGWGRGDAIYACDVRTGNCTDFHSLFIAEARSVGVPARFVMGLPLPPEAAEGDIAGYHCWSEFWLDERGWVPVDASEAHKRPEMHDFFFGNLDADRVELTIGRDLDLPGATVQDLNYVIYPHVEVDGRMHEAVETTIRFQEASSDAAAG